MKTTPSNSLPPAVGPGHTPTERPSAYDGSLPVIPPGFYQISGAGYLQPGDLNWSDYKQEWREYYRAGYCIGNTSVLCRPSDATKAAIAGISADIAAKLAEVRANETRLMESETYLKSQLSIERTAHEARIAALVGALEKANEELCSALPFLSVKYGNRDSANTTLRQIRAALDSAQQL